MGVQVLVQLFQRHVRIIRDRRSISARIASVGRAQRPVVGRVGGTAT
jgi:hypothetical protein